MASSSVAFSADGSEAIARPVSLELNTVIDASNLESFFEIDRCTAVINEGAFNKVGRNQSSHGDFILQLLLFDIIY